MADRVHKYCYGWAYRLEDLGNYRCWDEEDGWEWGNWNEQDGTADNSGLTSIETDGIFGTSPSLDVREAVNTS